MQTPSRPEKVEQAHGVRLLRLIGAAVYVSGTVRRRGYYQGTMQTPGIPDVEAWLPWPPRGTSSDAGPTRQQLKWEAKRAGGRLSPAQQAYQRHCRDAGVAHVVGPVDALRAWLIGAGYLNSPLPPLKNSRK